MASTPTFHCSVTPYFRNPHHHHHHHHLSLPTSTLLSLPPTKPRNLKITICQTTAKQNAETESKRGIGGGGDLRVMFAAGGTGGHIYPAVAIADELRVKNPNTQILFIGNPNGMEGAAVTSAGYDFAAVAASPLARPLLSPQNIFLFPYRLIKSLIESLRRLRDFDPQIVIGTGGYVSFPICFAAAIKGLKLVIQEQNSVPGIANWVLSLFADKVFVAFDATVECFPRKNCVVCGNPVRLSLKKSVSKVVARENFFPRSGAKMRDLEANVLLVLGGSLGANAINIALLNLYYLMLMEYKNLFIIWQTGLKAFDEMESLVKNHPRLILTPFLHSMDLAYAAADLIVSRAGAMTCYEILATGKPSILIPSPNVAEGHQFKNASLMADLAGSRVITEDELDSTTLGTAIEEILGNESLMAEMSEKALKATKPNASAAIVEHILSLVNFSAEKGGTPSVAPHRGNPGNQSEEP
ncbi:uncharacterized protein LOC130767435 isoform X2 [Actinidia eriantha]|uniref:uncharacterized protein LOC130767435 isoform X2 n=1 Tax=Actinidia eriantha TaxID=165200 RepID=UPI00258F54C8|nr:uncharacterized protein LOC130767435 isoform X2 [Actinidia eriantha]